MKVYSRVLIKVYSSIVVKSSEISKPVRSTFDSFFSAISSISPNELSLTSIELSLTSVGLKSVKNKSSLSFISLDLENKLNMK